VVAGRVEAKVAVRIGLRALVGAEGVRRFGVGDHATAQAALFRARARPARLRARPALVRRRLRRFKQTACRRLDSTLERLPRAPARHWARAQGLRHERAGGGDAAGRCRAGRRAQHVRFGGHVLGWRRGGIARAGAHGAAPARHPFDQGHLPRGVGRERGRLVAPPPDRGACAQGTKHILVRPAAVLACVHCFSSPNAAIQRSTYSRSRASPCVRRMPATSLT
jgi:hypothetical protein